MTYSRLIRRAGVWALYERLDARGHPSTLPPRYYIVRRSRGLPQWSTVQYHTILRAAQEALDNHANRNP
jgi:hypothetical protein